MINDKLLKYAAVFIVASYFLDFGSIASKFDIVKSNSEY